MTPLVSISIVSHAQGAIIGSLLKDLDRVCAHEEIEVLLVLNIPEELPFDVCDFLFPLKIIRNDAPKGFGENHNASFLASTGLYFCVMNPDIRMDANPFPALIGHFDDASVGLAAPMVMSPQGQVEDSARTFPTPLTILCKALSGYRKTSYVIDQLPVYPHWVGGMFMLFPSAVFRELCGFDTSYFLYYEDVDICARLTLAGQRIVLSPFAVVIHHAQRTSWRRLQYLRWHLRSMLRFFCSEVCWRVHWRGLRLGKARHCASASFRDKP